VVATFFIREKSLINDRLNRRILDYHAALSLNTIEESMTINLFFWTPYLLWLYQRLKHWSQPVTYLVSGITSDLIRSRTDLLIENAMLRQQLIILN